MDQVLKIKRRLNPRLSANILSIVTLAYTFSTFIKGYREPLNAEDIPDVLDNYRSSKLGDKLQKYWKLERASNPPSLWRAIRRAFGAEYMLLGIGLLFDQICLRLIRAIALSQLVNAFSDDNKAVDLNNAYMSGGLIVITSFLSTFVFHLTYQQLQLLAMKIRTACGSLVYRKSLKLSFSALHIITTGKIINILSNDLRRFDGSLVSSHYLWICPVEIGLLVYVLYTMVGLTSSVGILFMVILVPLQVYLGKKCTELRRRTAVETDKRIKFMNEIVTGIGVIKLYAWEKPLAELVNTIRRLEVREIRAMNYLRGCIYIMGAITHKIAIFLAIVTYVLTGNRITAVYVFAVTCLYDNLRLSLNIHVIFGIISLSELRVTIKRIENLFLAEEKPSYNGRLKTNINLNLDTPLVELIDVCAKWSKNSRNVLNRVTLKAEASQLIGITGPVGSGKSSIIHAILNELYVEYGSLNLRGKVSYASQEPWVFTGNLQQNILFGQPLDRKRYNNVLRVCALERDLRVLPYGDQTLVGERGVILSGGQKSRVNIARAVYRNANVYLLDDPFSAVDVHVGKHIFEQCIKQFLNKKCVILITHQLQYFRMFNYLYVLDKGKVISKGTYDQLKERPLAFFNQPPKVNIDALEEYHNTSEKATISPVQDQQSPDNTEEHRNTGTVSKSVFVSYLMAGKSLATCLITALVFILSQIVYSAADYFTGYWVNEEQKKANGNYASLSDRSYVYIYAGMTLFLVILTSVSLFGFFNLATHISIGIHNKTFTRTINTSINFFHTNYSGRIINRFSKDIGIIDESIPSVIIETFQTLFGVLGSIIIISIVNPWLLLSTVALLVLLYFLSVIYLRSSRNIKRLEGTALSPIFGHVNETIKGITTVRAFKSELQLQKEFDCHQDWHSSVWDTYITCSKAFSVYTDLVGVFYIGIITFDLLLNLSEQYSGNVGLAITQGISLMSVLYWGLMQATVLEIQMTSVERVLEYTKLKPENTRKGPVPPSSWPESGSIQFSSVSLRYTSKEPYVLKNLNFCIDTQQKVGIVGRTGAGKTSVLTALFQMYNTEGSIMIDNLDITKIPLDILRSRISIIPQDPTLFSGTVRSNLDPFGLYPDVDLWAALDDVKLKEAISKLSLGLGHTVSDGGANFSVGQKQLICLGRAILRKNKILVLDEATSNIDLDTDNLIQNTIRNKFLDYTVLTIAHRLNTIMDSDKLLVIDAGEMVEFDHPYALLQNQNGMFYSMLQKSGPEMAKSLYSIAKESYFKKVTNKT